MTFIPSSEFIVYETSYWRVNQRVDCSMPGYLMLAPSDINAVSFSTISPEALIELGSVLGKVTSAIEKQLHPRFLHVARFGHMPGHNLHFHIIPVYDWIIEQMEADQRYEKLRELKGLEAGKTISGEDFDGPEITLFISREFAGRAEPATVQGLEMAQVLELLRKALAVA